MNNSQDRIYKFVEAVETEARSQLKKRCESFVPDFSCPEIFSVLSALLARQTTLMIEMASAPQLWNGHSAPLFLRAMTDVHITISWIILEPEARSKEYIEHGLGQAVLMLEHRKAGLENAHPDDKAEVQKAIEAEQGWVDAQKWNFLVDVNVGAWSGKNTRTMAEEAGILDFYNYVYTPFSQCAHSTWYHVGKYNSKPSDSPLTRPLWQARIAPQSSDVWDLNLAAKYLDKTFNLFDEKVLNVDPSSTIQDWMHDKMDELFPKNQLQSDQN